MYNSLVHPKCQEEMNKLCKKSPILEEALKKKMNEIIQNPYHYKPLRYDLYGIRRVHIMKSFVLKYEIVESTKTVKFLKFGHHDEAYRR